MNRLNPLTSDVLGTVSNIFNQGMQKAHEWTGHIVNYVKQTPEMLAQNPTAAIALIFSANTLFLFIMNSAVNRLDNRLADESKERSYKQIFICEPLFAASVFAFNSLLSKVTKAQLSYEVITAITATALALRILINHVLFKQEAETPEAKVEQPSPILGKQDTPKLEEILRDETPEKPSVPSPKHNVEIAALRLEIARETARANKLLSQQSDTEVKIKELESEIAQLKSAQDTLEAEKKKALNEGSAAKQEVDRLEKERYALESEKGSLLEQVKNLQSDLDQAEKAKREAEKALETLDEKTEKEREQANIETATLNERAAKAEKEVLTVTNNAKVEKKSLEDRIAAIMKEKADAIAAKDKIVDALKANLQKIDGEKTALQDLLDQAEDDKIGLEQQLDAAKDKEAAAIEEAKKANKEKTRMQLEKEGAYDEKDQLVDDVKELQKQLALKEDIIRALRIKSGGIKDEPAPKAEQPADEAKQPFKEPAPVKPDPVKRDDTPRKPPTEERGRASEKGTGKSPNRSRSNDAAVSKFSGARKPAGGIQVFGAPAPKIEAKKEVGAPAPKAEEKKGDGKK